MYRDSGVPVARSIGLPAGFLPALVLHAWRSIGPTSGPPHPLRYLLPTGIRTACFTSAPQKHSALLGSNHTPGLLAASWWSFSALPRTFCLCLRTYGQKISVDTIINSESTLYASILQPLFGLLPDCRHTRECKTFSDQDWLTLGTLRVFQESPSGRGFLQQLLPHCAQAPSLSLFFENLKSTRRLALCAEANALLRQRIASQLPDALAKYPELAGFGVFAGDGSYFAAACHDSSRDSSSGTPVKYPTGHFFAMDLRTMALAHLIVADQIERKREHDLRALKRLDPEQLRQGTPSGRKVLWAWDRAITDFRLWHHLKQTRGIYFITRQKDNFAPMPCGLRQFDARLPVNHGIRSDELVGHGSSSVAIRRITFLDPLSGKTYLFLTNEMTLPPGLLALIYKMRWDIEKAFDQAKNKFGEKKSWASSATAKAMQAHFLCLAHNLALLQEHQLARQEGITNVAEHSRKSRRLAADRKNVHEAGAQCPPALQSLQRFTQRSLKFIRWLRMFLFLPAPWERMLAILRRLYATT